MTALTHVLRPRLASTKRFEVACMLDLEHTADSLHAYVEIEDLEIGPGDQVLVLDVDTRLRFGERRRCPATAIVTRAGWMRRQWTKLLSMLELTSLYDISFSDRRTL